MNQGLSKHTKVMIIACGIPLLAILILPMFGITGLWLWLPAGLFMVGGHLFMMKSHNHQN